MASAVVRWHDGNYALASAIKTDYRQLMNAQVQMMASMEQLDANGSARTNLNATLSDA